MDGRKHTGGRLEVKVRLREPLNGPDKQTSSERWLVIDQSQVSDHRVTSEDEHDIVWREKKVISFLFQGSFVRIIFQTGVGSVDQGTD